VVILEDTETAENVGIMLERNVSPTTWLPLHSFIEPERLQVTRYKSDINK
jgi:hypothetical protein